MELHGAVAIVTGGAVRVGRSLALALASKGADVAVHYGSSRDEADETVSLIRGLGVRSLAVSANLNEPAAAADTIFAAVERELGPASVLVNSASIFEPGTLDSTDQESWDRHLRINLEAPLRLSQRFVRSLAGDGCIVNIADWRAERPFPGQLAYTVSKSGLITLTKLLAQELAPRIRVNAIAPGAVLRPESAGPEYDRRLAENVPLRRTGSPDDVADALLFLLKNDFITGEVLHITGGEEL